MNYLDIKLAPNTLVFVVGDIHEHEAQFDEIVNKIKPSKDRIFVSVGDIFDKGHGIDVAKSIIRKIRALTELGHAYIVKGNHEYKHIRKSKYDPNLQSDELAWIEEQPLTLSFSFANRTRLTVVHGGVTPKHTWADLENNSDVVYIRTIDEQGEYIPLKYTVDPGTGIKALRPARPGHPWAESYDGRFGYIAFGHDPQKDGIPKFYPHACNLDSACYITGILTAQCFSENGLEELIQVKTI